MSDWRDEWDYYSESRPRKVTGGIKTKRERGSIGDTWWSRRWVRVLESLGMGTRLARGRSYAHQGQVVSLDIQPGLVKARVQGSRIKPYEIAIRFQPLAQRDWEKVTEAMAAQAIFAAKLLAGEMPDTIEEAFAAAHVTLFPTSVHELDTTCTCPDWANPCKHSAAVYYILADRFDEDPFLLFKLRGCDKETLIAALRKQRNALVPPAEMPPARSPRKREESPALRLEDTLATFWQAGEGLETFVVKPQQPEVDKAVLKRLGEAPFAPGDENITAVLSRAYDLVHQAALRKIEELQATDPNR